MNPFDPQFDNIESDTVSVSLQTTYNIHPNEYTTVIYYFKSYDDGRQHNDGSFKLESYRDENAASTGHKLWKKIIMEMMTNPKSKILLNPY